MTYLGPLRLHFHGQFQATVSTVNNTPSNFDPDATSRDQGWNPGGDADWRLLGCEITSANLADGTPAAAGDPVLRCLVADSDRRVPGKIVDLDPEQQMCSMIFGLEVRVCDVKGETLVIGRFDPAPFTELWQRARAGGQRDMLFGAFYQSVITDLEWSDAAGSSPMLSALRAAATDGLLSMKFNVDGYDWIPGSETFGRGRIAGTIGVAGAHEPRHFVAGRHFLPGPNPSALNTCVAVVDEELGKVFLDLGNALPTKTRGGDVADIGTLTLAHGGGDIGTIDGYQQPGWYERTAGVVALPADRRLTPAELTTIAEAPLRIKVHATSTGDAGAIDEAPGGLYARADQFVFRLDPGGTAPVRVFATRFGKPRAGGQIRSRLDASGLQAVTGDPAVATPAGAVSFAATVPTGPDGVADLPIVASRPGRPRGYIEGQVYGVRPALAETLTPGYPRVRWNFVSLLVHDTFDADEPPTWSGSIKPVFEQYANLYPIMGRFLNLASYESVCEHRELLLLAFGLPIDDPNSMPVTRDLSASARTAILRWLTEVGADGNPLRGTPSHEAEAPPAPRAATPAATDPDHFVGKAAAMERMVGERAEAQEEG